jgi:hypothetical protein
MKKTLFGRALACLVAMLMIATTLAACQPNVPEDPNQNQNQNKEALALITQGLSDYTIIRPETTSAGVRQATADLTTALSSATGCTFKPGTDWVNHGESAPTDTLEILVGLTNRQESIDAHAALKEKEYTVRIMGERLVLVGYDDSCTVAAVAAFLKLLPTLVTEGHTLSLAKDFKLLDEYVRYPWLNEFDKSSLAMYLGDKLTCAEEDLLYFEPDLDGIEYPGSTSADDGIAFTCTKDTPQWKLIDTGKDAFSMSVTDKFAQTVKMWVYVNDINLMGCDHDAVYGTPQVGSGTLYITLHDDTGHGHTWQHTFYGSGWHEIELSFTCHNVAYQNLDQINYGNLNRLSVWCIGYEGLEVQFDDMRLCTYNNPGYTKPEAPHGGRWLSTCDFEALDGPILTEWYGSFFDLDEKTQGSSSVAIAGHKENVDHRVCIGIDNVPVYYEEDTICFDMYISSLSLLGTDWQIRLEHNAQAAHYSVNYNILKDCAVDENGKPTSLKGGQWNHIRLPLNKTRVVIGEGYEDVFTNDLVLTQLVFFIAGTGTNEDQNYLIRYDNFYVTKTENLPVAQ